MAHNSLSSSQEEILVDAPLTPEEQEIADAIVLPRERVKENDALRAQQVREIEKICAKNDIAALLGWFDWNKIPREGLDLDRITSIKVVPEEIRKVGEPRHQEVRANKVPPENVPKSAPSWARLSDYSRILLSRAMTVLNAHLDGKTMGENMMEHSTLQPKKASPLPTVTEEIPTSQSSRAVSQAAKPMTLDMMERAEEIQRRPRKRGQSHRRETVDFGQVEAKALAHRQAALSAVRLGITSND